MDKIFGAISVFITIILNILNPANLFKTINTTPVDTINNVNASNLLMRQTSPMTSPVTNTPKPTVESKNQEGVYFEAIMETIERWCKIDVENPPNRNTLEENLFIEIRQKYGIPDQEILNKFNQTIWTNPVYSSWKSQIKAAQTKYCTVKRTIPPIYTYGN